LRWHQSTAPVIWPTVGIGKGDDKWKAQNSLDCRLKLFTKAQAQFVIYRGVIPSSFKRFSIHGGQA
jgi:hypothetical protein